MLYSLTLKTCVPEGEFSGYASVFNTKDLHGDVILPGAFQNSLATWKNRHALPKLLWQHNLTQPIGIWKEIYEDSQGLFVKGQLLLELAQGKEAYALLKAGVIDSLSIGFHPIKRKTYGKSSQAYLEEIDLREISLVTVPANEHAKIFHVKSLAIETRIHHLIQKINAL